MLADSGNSESTNKESVQCQVRRENKTDMQNSSIK